MNNKTLSSMVGPINSPKGSAKSSIKISVKTLIEFAARTGDLFAEHQVGPSALEGIRGHQHIQRTRQSEDEQWQCEYRLKQPLRMGQYDVTLHGRLDLLNAGVTPAIIEEIKTSYQPPTLIAQAKKQLHWAQAKVYAYLYCLSLSQAAQALEQPTMVRVSWYDLTEKKLHSDSQQFTVEALKTFTDDLLDIYLQWLEKFTAAREETVKTAKQLAFPFAQYRTGQYDFARTVYCTIRDKKALLAEAPTGTGKTMSTLFPAVKAFGEGKLEQIVYLTNKGSAQDTARQSLAVLAQKGLDMGYLVIQAKDKTCPCRSDDPLIAQACEGLGGKCNRTVDFFSRLPAGRLACLEAGQLTPQVLGEIAQQHQLCPFELCLQMVRWSSVVICDVNYLFDPMVKLAAFDDKQNSRALLIDEIHNLPDRARDMYSATLSGSQTKAMASVLSDFPQLKKRCQSLGRALTKLGKEPQSLPQPPPAILRSIELIMDTLGEVELNSGLGNDVFAKPPEGFSDWLKQLYRYVVISELYDDSHTTLVTAAVQGKVQQGKFQQGKRKETTLRLICLEAAGFLAQRYRCARSTVGFSATLSPVPFYRRSLGLEKRPEKGLEQGLEKEQGQDALMCRLPAVFAPQNQLTLRCDYIDTRWAYRPSSIAPLVDLILTVFHHRPGKYLVFFPSYKYLNDVYDAFLAVGQRQQGASPLETVKQVAGASAAEREAFVNAFLQNKGLQDDGAQPGQVGQVIGFAIMGGIFGEGVDYAGDALTGAIVIGTGMPQPNEEQKLIEAYFERQGLNSFQYAYQFPGFTRVLQTAGRVIRSETDRGVVVLVDPRFRRFDYQQLMPEHWRVVGCSNPRRIEEALKGFWAKGYGSEGPQLLYP
ncbi:MAG: DNA excision repair protein ERCC-2 [Phenylobacterium sp.]|jgi:DNA excision repair protein ERCC-2